MSLFHLHKALWVTSTAYVLNFGGVSFVGKTKCTGIVGRGFVPLNLMGVSVSGKLTSLIKHYWKSKFGDSSAILPLWSTRFLEINILWRIISFMVLWVPLHRIYGGVLCGAKIYSTWALCRESGMGWKWLWDLTIGFLEPTLSNPWYLIMPHSPMWPLSHYWIELGMSFCLKLLFSPLMWMLSMLTHWTPP